MNAAQRRHLYVTVAEAIVGHAEELTALDQAVGDGDHGLNMKRGFEAVLAEADALAAKPLPAGLKALGMILVTKVGGASGPLFGTLAMALGDKISDEPNGEEVGAALAHAITTVMQRSKAQLGQKTMLDVLAPVQSELADSKKPLLELVGQIKKTADAAAEATVPMKAIRGRASYLGDRSVGHMDPGSRSACLIIGAVCDVIDESLS